MWLQNSGTRRAGEVEDVTCGRRREEWEGRLARLRERRTESQAGPAAMCTFPKAGAGGPSPNILSRQPFWLRRCRKAATDPDDPLKAVGTVIVTGHRATGGIRGVVGRGLG